MDVNCIALFENKECKYKLPCYLLYYFKRRNSKKKKTIWNLGPFLLNAFAEKMVVLRNGCTCENSLTGFYC